MEYTDIEPRAPVLATVAGAGTPDLTIPEGIEALGRITDELAKCVGEFSDEGAYIAERAVEMAQHIEGQYVKLMEAGRLSNSSGGKVAEAIDRAITSQQAAADDIAEMLAS